MSRHIRLPAFVVLIAFTVAALGCSTWKSVPITDAQSYEWIDLIGKDVKVYMMKGRVFDMHVVSVDYPYIHGGDPLGGRSWENENMRTIDLREVRTIQVLDRQTGKTIAAIVGITLLVVIFIVFITFRIDFPPGFLGTDYVVEDITPITP
ncbi:MAG: hypothetical protein IH969_01300 [Candidatus Krumholzibacteriota bacterium]|nr:hypothetical protein [Candidatus Krumholzibacteriota bacterium]